jgi:23S rRNA pseudouridine1911/1915/1917 synthase
MQIPILYKDSHILAINKPAGLVVHSDGRTKEKTMVNWILENYPKTKDVGEPIQLSWGKEILRPGIVHRLDRDTSGVLLIAKTEEGFTHLKEQFQNRTIKKTYNAFVYGAMKEEEGTINRPIARSRKDFRLWSAQRGARGEMREAVTNYKVIKTKEDIGESGASFIEVKPITGRTHQIRVHFKAINHPVVADLLYAPKKEPVLGFKRLALHASMLEFKDLEGKKHEIIAEFPDDFKVALSYFS